MSFLLHSGVWFHGVAELRSVDRLPGLRLQRVPESVRQALNEKAAKRMQSPDGAEIRFVSDGWEIDVTLSCPATPCEVIPFWGGIQGHERHVISEKPTTLHLTYPERLRRMKDRGVGASGFSPDVWRLTLRGCDKHGVAHFHDIDGEGLRPPAADQVPARTYLAYGTSITEGFSASAMHLSFIAQTARRLGTNYINLGCAGSGYCEQAMADYIANRDDWHFATLEISINMVGAGFSVEAFRERAGYLIDRIGGSDPTRPVVCIVPIPYFGDLCAGIEGSHRAETAEAYRETLRALAAASPHPNIHLAEGSELFKDLEGYTADLAHPGDAGMTEIAETLARVLEEL